MPLSQGACLGPYEIAAQIGAGGMGEVYRATDSRLKRQVAIKILPPALSTDPDRLARFQREAEVLASLNHPNIAAIHGLETGGDTPYLVMEFVEGDDLSERLGHGAMPVNETVPIAKQICEALEAAHEQGIIHRDLKPANIKVRPDGTVKVLDFGLAKAMDPQSTLAAPAGAGSLSMSPTITTPAMTRLGMILGTAGYMSPEQARGKTVDRRADIWAFGCVLFEMLTGRRAFEAEDVSLTLAEVMKSEPDWRRLPAISPALAIVLRHCLEKDPRRRMQSIGDVRLALEGEFEIAVPQTAPQPARRSVWFIAAPIAAASAALAGSAVWVLNRPIAPDPQRVSVMLPADQSIAFGCTPCLSIAISPDGAQIAYATTKTGAQVGGIVNGALYVRTHADRSVRELPGTSASGVLQPFFSPDGKWVAFFTNSGELKKIALAGGTPITVLANVGRSGRFSAGAWVDDNTIVIDGRDGIRRVSADGGSVVGLTTVDAAHGESRHGYPELVAGTKMLLFTTEFGGSRPERIEAVNLDGSGRRVVLENASVGRYITSGHLLFRRESVLLVARFDPGTLQVLGSAVPLADDVRVDGPNADGPTPQVAISQGGTLAYVPGVNPMRVLGTVTRTGVFAPLPIPPDRIDMVAVSPTGQAVAFDVSTGASKEVRIYDLTRDSPSKVTAPGWYDSRPAWHPNGRTLAVISRAPDGKRGIFVKEPGKQEQFLEGTGAVSNDVLSWLPPDGSVIAYSFGAASSKQASQDIWIATTSRSPETRVLLNGPAGQNAAVFSRDGHYLAYIALESGRSEVYVQPYPQGERTQVSATGGFGPAWGAEGKELFFQTTIDGIPKVMAASLSRQGDRIVAGKPVALFDMRVTLPSGVREQYSSSSITGRRWDAFPGGQRFLMVRGPDPQGMREIVLVQHWDQELNRLTSKK